MTGPKRLWSPSAADSSGRNKTSPETAYLVWVIPTPHALAMVRKTI
jgi:hypothetical protein